MWCECHRVFFSVVAKFLMTHQVGEIQNLDQSHAWHLYAYSSLDLTVIFLLACQKHFWCRCSPLGTRQKDQSAASYASSFLRNKETYRGHNRSFDVPLTFESKECVSESGPGPLFSRNFFRRWRDDGRLTDQFFYGGCRCVCNIVHTCLTYGPECGTWWLDWVAHHDIWRTENWLN